MTLVGEFLAPLVGAAEPRDIIATLLWALATIVFAWWEHVHTMNRIRRMPPEVRYLALLQYRFGDKIRVRR